MIKLTNKLTLLYLLSLLSLVSTMPVLADLQAQSVEIVDQHGTLSEPLKKIAALTKIVHNGTLDDVVKQTQKTWLRKAGTERWEMQNAYESLRSLLWPLLTDISLINAVYPEQENYDYCIVLGATAPTMRARFAYAIELWQQGISFKELIFLVGQRMLDPQIETNDLLYPTNTILPIKQTWKKPNNQPKTETDAARILCEQTTLPPKFIDAVKISFVDTQGKTNSQGAYLRPTTGDTVHAWLAQNPKAGSILAISNQPFVNYQNAVLKTLLPKTFALETVGCSVCNDIKMPVIFDTLARWLYQENIYLKKSITTQ